ETGGEQRADHRHDQRQRTELPQHQRGPRVRVGPTSAQQPERHEHGRGARCDVMHGESHGGSPRSSALRSASASSLVTDWANRTSAESRSPVISNASSISSATYSSRVAAGAYSHARPERFLRTTPFAASRVSTVMTVVYARSRSDSSSWTARTVAGSARAQSTSITARSSSPSFATSTLSPCVHRKFNHDRRA